MTTGEKQLRFMMYAKIKHPHLTVGQAAKMMQRFNAKLAVLMDERV